MVFESLLCKSGVALAKLKIASGVLLSNSILELSWAQQKHNI